MYLILSCFTCHRKYLRESDRVRLSTTALALCGDALATQLSAAASDNPAPRELAVHESGKPTKMADLPTHRRVVDSQLLLHVCNVQQHARRIDLLTARFDGLLVDAYRLCIGGSAVSSNSNCSSSGNGSSSGSGCCE
jgi:hypothetical protein